MTLHRARVIPAADAASATRIPAPQAQEGHARIVPGALVAAREEATRLLEEARAKAAAIVAEAEVRARATAAEAGEAARAKALADLAAAHLALHAREEARAGRELDRTVEIAVLLAERMIGEALAVDPSRIAALAAEALRETRGARKLRIEASPEDVASLAAALAELGQEIAEIAPNPDLGRGSVLVETELGNVDARLAPRLGQLAQALREALAEDHARGPAGIGGSR